MATTTPRPARRTPARRPRWLRRPRWSWRRALLVAGGLLLAGILLVAIVYARTKIPPPSELGLAQTTVISYADGSELLRLRGEQNRTDVPLADVPEHVRRAVLAAEDRNYYRHSGISVRGIARAAVRDVLGGELRQGGSTITQQYARNVFLNRRRSFARKFREAIVAVKLDRTYSKDQVFEWYLNTIYFGRGAYGIEAAARTFFGVPAKALTVEQGAVLAALIRSPEGGDPAVAPETARRRWQGVLDGMVKQRWLDERAAAAARYPQLRARGTAGLGGSRGHLRDAVYNELRAHGFAANEIYAGGLRVTTTLDRRAQDAAAAAMREVLDDPARDPNAALVAIEPGTGRIKALYGGGDYVRKQFDYAMQGRRQPGSAFKPIVLAAALDRGVSLRSRFDGRSPQRFGDYEVENFGPGRGEQFGRIDLVEATVHSVNTIYVPLGLQTGVGRVLDAAHELGIPEKVTCEGNRDATLFLGSCVQRPVDLAAVYATFAAQGRHAPPYLVQEVKDRDGNRRYRAEPKSKQAFDADVMADATYAMRQVVERGTATRARIDRPAAGKTGTTTGNTDAWFAGYVPQLATAVWLGYDPPTDKAGRPTGPTPPMRNLHGFREVTGGTLPAAIWSRFMRAALQGVPVRDFPPPSFQGRTVAPTLSPTGTPSATASPTPLPTPSLSPPPTPSERPVPTLFPSSPPAPSSPPPTPEPTASPTPGGSASP